MECKMKKLFAFFVLIVALSLPAFSSDVTNQDKQNFKSIITSQLEAFKADNGPAAYSFAAPLVTKIFPNPEIFMTMVQRGYPPVYRNEKFTFGATTTDQMGRPVQHVIIRTADGKVYEALYAMELEADGMWKIAGCTLAEIEETGA
jgi:Domain of unknown function (DUF4864)